VGKRPVQCSAFSPFFLRIGYSPNFFETLYFGHTDSRY
jgi:hypothetical protein